MECLSGVIQAVNEVLIKYQLRVSAWTVSIEGNERHSSVNAFSTHNLIYLKEIVYLVHVACATLYWLDITWVKVELLKRRVMKYNY